jgi:EAL domain-containing protein (putative c-di-GMP-specific phosphodiesterase class I)
MEHTAADVRKLHTIDDAILGLDRREFFFVYQPKLRLQEGQLAGFESLLRWRHPSYGVLTPDSFIDLVENSALTERFTDFVVTEAVRTLADWTERGYNTLSLAVNLPPCEVSRPGLANKLSGLLGIRSIDTSRLQIELTEATDPGPIDVLVSAVESLRASGVSVAIDDFGAGCWSLTILHRLGVDTLKLDRKFMFDIQENANSKVVVEALVQLGQRLGKQVVIEGVETQAQFEWIRTMGHVDCQGYYISAPIANEHIDGFVATHGLIH